MAVRELAKLINVNENHLESFFSLFTQVNPDKVINLLYIIFLFILKKNLKINFRLW